MYESNDTCSVVFGKEIIVGKENLQRLNEGDSSNENDHPLEGLDWKTRWRLLKLYRKTRRYLDLIVDVHGEQIFIDGIFNGDPRK